MYQQPSMWAQSTKPAVIDLQQQGDLGATASMGEVTIS